MSELRTGTFGEYYGSPWGQSSPLNQTQMNKNAAYIRYALTAAGWTIQAIAATLGNMQAESTINPGRWQSDDVNNTSMGYGLVQWTPSTNYTDWCAANNRADPSEMDNAIARLLYELDNGLQWIATSSYNFDFKTFSKSTDTPEKLAAAFLLNYERPADQSEAVQAYRGVLATTWYTYLTGGDVPITPPTPGESTTKKRKFNFLLFGRKPWRYQL